MSYTKLDKKIDDYLKTRNIKPGPPARLINKILNQMDNTKPTVKQTINFLSFTMNLTRNIIWSDLTGVKIFEYGSEPSFYLEFLNSKLLILKSANDLSLYYFGSLLAYGFDIKTPKCRIIEYSDPEFDVMLQNLERASHSDEAVYNKILYDVKSKPFVILYEYVPIITLLELGNNRTEFLLKEKHFKSRELMINIGKIIAFDIFINNNKRLPFVWLNNGDANNIGFKIFVDLLPPAANFKDPKIIEVFIDNVYVFDTYPNVLDPNDKVMNKNLGDYLNSLNQFFKLLCYEFKSITLNGKDLESFKFQSYDKLINLFYNSTGYKLTSFNLFHITLGIFVMVNQIIETDLDLLNQLINFVIKDAIYRDWADTYFQYAKSLKYEYFKYIKGFFEKIKDDNDLIFNWIDQNTFGFYQSHPRLIIPNIITEQIKLRVDNDPNLYKGPDGKFHYKKDKGTPPKSEKIYIKIGNLNSVGEIIDYDYISDTGELDDDLQIIEEDIMQGEQKITQKFKSPKDLKDFHRKYERVVDKDSKVHYRKREVRDFFNYNEKDYKVFRNDVHNGIYDIAPLDEGMIYGFADRVYNYIEEKPPSPKDNKSEFDEDEKNNIKKDGDGDDDDDKNKNQESPVPNNDFNPDHKIYTMDELKNKIKKDELYELLQIKKKLNPEEAQYLENKIKEVDENFEEKIEKDKLEQEEINKKLIEANANTQILDDPNNCNVLKNSGQKEGGNVQHSELGENKNLGNSNLDENKNLPSKNPSENDKVEMEEEDMDKELK